MQKVQPLGAGLCLLFILFSPILLSDEILGGDALVVDDAAYGLGEDAGHRELLHLHATVGVGDGISENHLFEG